MVALGGAVVRADLYDMNTGKPVEGAHLTVARLAEGQQNQAQSYDPVGDAVSNAEGRALVEKIPAGNVRITATAAGYAPRLLGYDRFGPAAFRPFNVSLAKASALRGIVADANGQPVAGAMVGADSLIAPDGRGMGWERPGKAGRQL